MNMIRFQIVQVQSRPKVCEQFATFKKIVIIIIKYISTVLNMYLVILRII